MLEIALFNVRRAITPKVGKPESVGICPESGKGYASARAIFCLVSGLHANKYKHKF